MPKSRKHILSQMFDVKPMKEDGNLHVEKIGSVKKCLNLKPDKNNFKEKEKVEIQDGVSRLPDGRPAKEALAPILTSYYQPSLKTTAWQSQPNLKNTDDNQDVAQNKNKINVRLVVQNSIAPQGTLRDVILQNQKIINELAADFGQEDDVERRKILVELENILSEGKNPDADLADDFERMSESKIKTKDDFWEVVGRYGLKNENRQLNNEQTLGGESIPSGQDGERETGNNHQVTPRKKRNSIYKYAILAGFLFIFAFGFYSLNDSYRSKDLAFAYALSAGERMMQAKEDLKNLNFKSAEYEFSVAKEEFSKSKEAIGGVNYYLISAASGLPFISSSKISGVNLIDAGEYLAKAGELLSGDMAKFSALDLKDVFKQSDAVGNKSGLTSALRNFNNDLETAYSYAVLAESNIDKVDLNSLPDNLRKADLPGKAKQTKEGIVEAQSFIKLGLNLLGAYRQQDYLLLFQNPGEIRATGGFIGSYGIISLDDGKVKKMFLDDIFNPDGQLKENIVPPFPIQKISTAWSLHDSNWFFDFPTSAKKAAWFYEKTGGPTVSGVVAFNPSVVERLLDVTGPIDMPEYGTAIVAENFIDTIQYKVEKDFNKEENKPKKILADFMPKFIERLFSKKENLPKIVSALTESIKNKDIMMYSADVDVQKIISENNFSGEVINSNNDYLAVVSSNINGYKTDRVVDENVDLKTEVDGDGYVVDTLTITKKHDGGSSKFDYYNKVNADYLRVYVPDGSILIDAKGQTLETDKSPVDYEKLGFKIDKDVQEVESSMVIDEKTKTQIYKESGKTVFGNWVYVSPKEDVEIIYKYRLPKRLYQGKDYEMIFQKQSGSNAKLNWRINVGSGFYISSGDSDLIISGSSASLSSDWSSDMKKILRFGF